MDNIEMNNNEKAPQAEPEPEVYALQRDGGRWKLSRRDFLIAAAATTAAAAYSPGPERAEAAPEEGSAQGLSHTKPIHTLDVSPNGRWLASGSEDNTVKLWVLPSGGHYKTLKGHSASVLAVAFSSDSKSLLSGSSDLSLRVWSLSDGSPQGKSTIQPVAETMQGGVLAIVPSPQGMIQIRGLGLDWKFAGREEGGKDLYVDVSTATHDGDVYTVTEKEGDGEPIVIQYDTRGVRYRLMPGGDWSSYGDVPLARKVVKMLEAPNETSGSLAGTMRLRSAGTGAFLRDLMGHQKTVRAVAVSPQGTLLASASDDATVRLWSLPDGKPVKTLEGHRGPVCSVAFSADGKTLASGGRDESIRLWTVPEGTLTGTLHGGCAVMAVVFSPKGNLLASAGGDGMVRLWSMPDRSLSSTLEGEKKTVRALAVTPDGKWLASAGDDCHIRLWSLPGGKLVGSLLDLAVNSEKVKGVSYRSRNEEGQWVTYTLPCGSPVPPGAVCTCNCVPGSIEVPRPVPVQHQVCSCDTVCSCHGHCTCNSVPTGGRGHYWYPN